MSDRESQPPPVGPARRVAFTAGTESLARPLDPGHELTIDNASGGPIWVRAGRGWADGGGPAEAERLRAEVVTLRGERDAALLELSRASHRLGMLVGVVEALADRLDYLQGLWGKEAITDRMAESLRAALAETRAEDTRS